MKITILGTGTFYVTNERSAQSYLIETNNKKILIDCGPGTLKQLAKIGLKPDDIDYIFLSHFHADHTSDLFAFQMNFRLKDFFSDEKDYKTPIIYGPKGIEEFTRKLSHVYQLPAFDNYDRIKYVPYNNQEIIVDNLRINTFGVSHNAFGVQADAFSIRIEENNKVFVYSGDTIKCEGVEKASENADIFICDASYSKGKGGAAHMDTLDIGEIAEKSNVKKVILTHFYPNTNSVDLCAEVKEKFNGEVVRGEDLMEIKL